MYWSVEYIIRIHNPYRTNRPVTEVERESDDSDAKESEEVMGNLEIIMKLYLIFIH